MVLDVFVEVELEVLKGIQDLLELGLAQLWSVAAHDAKSVDGRGLLVKSVDIDVHTNELTALFAVRVK